ncbi:hypothetical protein DHEL01_v200209 [Diaporthe helianthi]|uniref:Uncharacterized protein n=1 Tax=Diaporthe helianthi TaxID=158607 RepID=A0A2P5IFZ2_DIAHE|nr:hypothetical protein DHEL01_v200209 [Diaporthe helianthi]
MDMGCLFNNFQVIVATSSLRVNKYVASKSHPGALLTMSSVSEFRKEFKVHELARKSMELYQLGNELETLTLEVEMLREQCSSPMDTKFNTVAARTDARLG